MNLRSRLEFTLCSIEHLFLILYALLSLFVCAYPYWSKEFRWCSDSNGTSSTSRLNRWQKTTLWLQLPKYLIELEEQINRKPISTTSLPRVVRKLRGTAYAQLENIVFALWKKKQTSISYQSKGIGTGHQGDAKIFKLQSHYPYLPISIDVNHYFIVEKTSQAKRTQS